MGRGPKSKWASGPTGLLKGRGIVNWILEYSAERLGGETKGKVGSVRLWAQQAYVFVSLVTKVEGHVGPFFYA